MRTTILRIDDVDLIDRYEEEIANAISRHCDAKLTRFLTSDFSLFSGYCQTVQEEINLARANNARLEGNDIEGLLQGMPHWDQLRHTKLSTLSRGWGRFFSLVAQAVAQLPSDVGVVGRLSLYLDDDRFRDFHSICSLLNLNSLFVLDYDTVEVERLLKDRDYQISYLRDLAVELPTSVLRHDNRNY